MRQTYTQCSVIGMISKKLKQWRHDSGKTLLEVADAAGTSDATISRIETGKQRPTPELARRLEAVTGIPAESFVMGDAGSPA